ncbi:MAG: hypothetical protein ACQES9_02075 [Myxococcota bacterium]
MRTKVAEGLKKDFINGFQMDFLFYHGDNNNNPLEVKIKLAGKKLVFSFPSNGLLAGMELRKDRHSLGVIDLSTRRKTLLSNAKKKRIFNFINSEKFDFEMSHFKQDKSKKNISKNYQFKVWKKDKIHRYELHLNNSSNKLNSKARKALFTFIFYPFNFNIPDGFEYKTMNPRSFRWIWKENGGGKIQWKLVSIVSKKFAANELIVDLEKYKKSTISEIFKGITRNTVVSHNSIQLKTRHLLGVVYLNKKLVDIIPPGKEIYLPLRKGAFISVYPLFGGAPVLDRYLKKPFIWKLP